MGDLEKAGALNIKYIENKVSVCFQKNSMFLRFFYIRVLTHLDTLSIRICVSCKGFVLVLFCKVRFIINFIMNVRMRVLFGREEMMIVFL